MIDFVRSNFVDTAEYAIDPNAGVIQEGAAMMLQIADTNNSGLLTAIPSLAASTTAVFLGLAMSVFVNPATLPYVDNITIPASAPYTATLTNTPVAPTNANLTIVTAGKLTVAGTVLTYNAGVGAAQFSVTGAVATFNSAQAGLTATISYQYTPTPAQLEFLQGDLYYGSNYPSATTGSIGVVRRGIIYTSMYDTSVDWTQENVSSYSIVGAGVSTGTGLPPGTVTISGTGVPIGGGSSAPQASNAYVTHVPTNDIPFLGLFIRA